MKIVSNVQQALVAAIGLILGLGLDHFIGGRPFRFVMLTIGLSACVIIAFFSRRTDDWKMMRAIFILSGIVFLLTIFDNFVMEQISWVPIGFWGTMFAYSLYRWKLLITKSKKGKLIRKREL